MKQTPEANEMSDAARSYSKHGHLILPAYGNKNGECSCGNPSCSSPAKHPATRHGLKDATSDIKVNEKRWGNGTVLNIGLKTGRDTGYFCLDIDYRNNGDKALDMFEAKHGALPPTYTVQTGNGEHRFFRYPDDGLPVRSSTGSGNRVGIDFKGDESYVITAPSRHINGNQYEQIDHFDDIGDFRDKIVDAPEWLLTLAREKTRHNEPASHRHVEDDWSIPEGARNITLTSLAGKLRYNGFSSEEIYVTLREANRRRCNNPLPDAEVKRIADSVGRYEPGASITPTEPTPLQRKLPEPSEFPIDALGEILGEAAKRMNESIQAPLAICGQSVLAGASLAVQAYADIEVDGRVSPLSEFFITIGQSGERKSAVDNQALRPHREHQYNLRKIYEQDIKSFKKTEVAYKKSMDEASGVKNKGFDKKQAALAELGDPPEPPLHPVFIMEEPTIEGMHKLLAAGHPSQGLFSDEGGRFIGGHGMNQDNQLKTASFLSCLWDGKPISRVRAGDGTSVVVGKRFSAHLMAQPDVAAMLLANHLLLNQGTLSRCLTTYPTSTAGSRLYQEIDLNTCSEFTRYERRILEILEFPYPLAENKRNELEPFHITLTPEAKKLWVSFHNAIEEQLNDQGSLSHIRGLGNKAPEHVLRLAGILHLVENWNISNISGISKVDLRFVKNAILLVQHYLNEATRLFSVGSADPDLVLAEKLLEWLRANEKQEVTLVEIYQYSLNSIRNAKTARKLVEILENHGWVEKLPNGAEFAGAHRTEAWRVRL